jgi:hypothetical protein
MSTPTTRNRFEGQDTGDNEETWGVVLNATLGLIDASADGWSAYALSGTKTLTSTNYAADEARMRVQHVSSGTGGTITIPGVEKWYIVRNASTGDVILTTGGGTTATIPTGGTQIVICDGTNCRIARDQTLYNELAAYVDATAFATQAGDYPALTGNGLKVLRVNSAGTTVEWGYEGKPVTAGALAFTAALNTSYEVDSSGGTIAVTLPAATNSGLCIEFFDKGSAGTNNITISRAGADTIDGSATTMVIDVNKGAVRLIDRSANWVSVPCG